MLKSHVHNFGQPNHLGRKACSYNQKYIYVYGEKRHPISVKDVGAARCLYHTGTVQPVKPVDFPPLKVIFLWAGMGVGRGVKTVVSYSCRHITFL